MIFPTWAEFAAATPEEQRLAAAVWVRTWENNYADQVAADVCFDRSDEMREWIDEFSTVGEDAARTRHAGKMTAARIRAKAMNAPAKIEGGEIIEAVIMKGDLSRLTPAERVEYYSRVCQSIGLNPLTQPFAYITLNGKLTLYAKRDAADQLRKVNAISIEILSRSVEDELYTVHVRARDAAGRTDEDFGTVPFPATLRGEARANAILKAVTKAKRRVTLSISGLGLMDETEVESISGARSAPTYDYDRDTGEIHEPSVPPVAGVAEQAAASQAIPTPNPPPESAAAEIDPAAMSDEERLFFDIREEIRSNTADYAALVKWWNGKEQIKRRASLPAAKLDELKAFIMARRK